jgi:hypothetical protein
MSGLRLKHGNQRVVSGCVLSSGRPTDWSHHRVNARTHSEAQVAKITGSIRAFGFANLVIRAQIVWAKERLVIGRGDYHWQHEPCWYAVRNKATGRATASRPRSGPSRAAARIRNGTGHAEAGRMHAPAVAQQHQPGRHRLRTISRQRHHVDRRGNDRSSVSRCGTRPLYRCCRSSLLGLYGPKRHTLDDSRGFRMAGRDSPRAAISFRTSTYFARRRRTRPGSQQRHWGRADRVHVHLGEQCIES